MTDTKVDGLPVSGYQPQPQSAIDIVNDLKRMEGALLDVLDTLPKIYDVDARWLAIGMTHIEQGFMAANRSVFKPKRVTPTV